MARRGVAGLVVVWLLVSGLGLACGRLDAQERAALVAKGQQLFTDKGCTAATLSAPPGHPSRRTSARTAARYPEATLARWLRDPAAQEPTRHMPNLQLSEAAANALAAYLASLR